MNYLIFISLYYYTISSRIVQYSTAQYSTVQHSTVQAESQPTPVDTLLPVPEVVTVSPTAGPVEGPAEAGLLVPVIPLLPGRAAPGLGPHQAELRLELGPALARGGAPPHTVRQSEVVVTVPGTPAVVEAESRSCEMTSRDSSSDLRHCLDWWSK